VGTALYTELGWLPKPPADFRGRCRELALGGTDIGTALTRLATYALDENQLLRLAAAIATLRAAGHSLKPLTPFRLGILGNSTLDPLIPALVATAVRHDIALECVKADFGQTIQEAVDPNSTINRSKPDAVLLALDSRGLPADVGSAIEYVRALRAGFRANAGALSIVQTLAPLPETLFGSFEPLVPGTARNVSTAFNHALVDDIRDSQDVMLDVASLAATVGLAAWHSPTQWNLGKFAFDSALLPLYAEHVCRVIGALRGKSRKCLVLDLDNTVWGGVIGDDGLDGIVLGQGNGTGEAFLEVQRMALALRDRGIVLAVSSKNTDDVARAAFQKHPEMLLRENHIAVFQANWNDKATNIVAIAQELALGIDAMVFLDDNPVERGLVREMLPAVAVPELPDNPALYARTLAAAGYFEAIAFSDEDRKRADFYADNARRVTLAQAAGDVDAYLASLDMEIVFRPFDSNGRSRISQLINKSNQFNLTTRRYTEVDVAGFEADETAFTLQVRLVDSFGDNGMISVIICKQSEPRVWEIDTWLMSCRVLGRRVEQMVLREILHHARNRGIERVVGMYRPSEKNAMVREHYPKLDFEHVADEEDGSTRWIIDTATEIESAPMRVDRAGF